MLNEIENHNKRQKEKVLNWKPDDLIETRNRIEIFKTLPQEVKNIIVSNLSINYILDGYATKEELSLWFNEDKTLNEEEFLLFFNKKIDGLTK